MFVNVFFGHDCATMKPTNVKANLIYVVKRIQSHTNARRNMLNVSGGLRI